MNFDNKFEGINEKCGTLNTITKLSTFSAVYSGILMLLTIPLNTVLIYVVLKNRRSKSRTIFYKLLLNIAAADLMTGIVGDTASMNFHIKESLQKHITLGETYLLHLSLFFTDAVALITMTFLSFDRIAALLYPIKYHNGMKARNENIIVGMIYPLAIILVAPYFKINYIKQLAVFTTINITLAILSLVATATIFKKHDNNIVEATENSVTSERRHTSTSLNCCGRKPESEVKSSKTITVAHRPKATLTKIQNKVTKTFLIMVGVFIVMYLPTCVTMIYMNSCGGDCDCFIVHIMRDVSIVSILSSSVFRPLNFLITIKQLREAALQLLQRSRSGSSTSLRTTSGSH